LNHIIGINRRRVFSLQEAQELLPVIFRLSKIYSEKVDALVSRLESLSGRDEASVARLETQVNDLVLEWQSKVQKLGALPKGLWIADFDAGDGYYCWKFPERSIEFWHSYSDGYTKRVSVHGRYSADLPVHNL